MEKQLEKKSKYKKVNGRVSSSWSLIYFLIYSISVFKSDQDIDKLRIFEHDFLCTEYAVDTILFDKIWTSVKEIWNVLDTSLKYETGRIRALRYKG